MIIYSFAAAAAAKSLQSCPTLCDPIDGSPPDSPVPGILHFLLQCTDAGRDWGQEEKGKTEDEMAGWHHQLDEHESE